MALALRASASWFKAAICVVIILASSSISFAETAPNSLQQDMLEFSDSLLVMDIDGNGESDALTDGLLLLRGMFGLTGDALITGVVAPDASYITADDIESRIAVLGNKLDIDDNQKIDALTDGLIILRYLFGLRGEVLIGGTVANDSERTLSGDIEEYMLGLMALSENTGPIITNFKAVIDKEEASSTSLYQIESTDAEGDMIYYLISGVDASFFNVSSTGLLAFIDLPDYENPADFNLDNIYEINVAVTDVALASADATSITSVTSKISATLDSHNTQVRVTNYDEDIIALSMTAVDGTSSSGPQINLSLIVDSYTSPSSISVLYQGPNAGQYWTSAGSPIEDNFKMTYQYTFSASDTSPSGDWRIRTIKMQTSEGEIEHSQSYLISKGMVTTATVYNPNSDTNKPLLQSISNPQVTGNDSDSTTNVVITYEVTVSDAENGYDKGHSRWQSPAHDGGWGYQGGWGSTDLSVDPVKTSFSATLDPKTVSGLYQFEDLRLYDKAGNRMMYYCRDTNNDGVYLLKSETGTLIEDAVCTVNIDNPIQDSATPQLTSFSLVGSINSDGRKVISHTYEIDNKSSWFEQESGLKRIYLRMTGPIGYDIYDGNLGFTGDTLLPLDAPSGTYSVSYFFVTDNALNDKKYYKDDMDALGFTTTVTFD
jgi:hypothetical protein